MLLPHFIFDRLKSNAVRRSTHNGPVYNEDYTIEPRISPKEFSDCSTPATVAATAPIPHPWPRSPVSSGGRGSIGASKRGGLWGWTCYGGRG